jgi:hypothetical protein
VAILGDCIIIIHEIIATQQYFTGTAPNCKQYVIYSVCHKILVIIVSNVAQLIILYYVPDPALRLLIPPIISFSLWIVIGLCLLIYACIRNLNKNIVQHNLTTNYGSYLDPN